MPDHDPFSRPPGDLPPAGQILIYHDGSTRLQVRLDGQTVWRPQRLIAELFQVNPCLENGKTAFVDFLANGQVGG